MANGKRQREREVEAWGLKAIIFKCSGCGCRIEVEADNDMREDAVCPCCAGSLAVEHRLFLLYRAMFDALRGVPESVRFRATFRGT